MKKHLPFSISCTKNSKSLSLKKILTDNYIFELQAEIVIVLGGDGFMLKNIHDNRDKIFYGINCGTLGFLMNSINDIKNLESEILDAKLTNLYPLNGLIETTSNEITKKYAINEISMLRSTPLASNLKIVINETVRIEKCVGDGIVVATPAGSTAYNRSLGGPIFPLESPIISLTPNNVFRPLGFKGALLNSDSIIEIEVIDPKKRKVSATFDFFMIKNIKKILINQDSNNPVRILFQKNNHLSDRIIRAQFLT